MEVAEVFDLTNWCAEHIPSVLKRYQHLQGVLDHNASQNQKQPVKGPMDDLVSALKDMPMTDLSLQQVEHLDEMGIAQFLGPRGAERVERIIKQSAYDVATSASEIKKATTAIERNLKTLQALETALKSASFQADIDEEHGAPNTALARIQFRHDASINSVAELKKWSSEWNDIARGIGHLVGETPHDLKINGATNGSIVVCVSGTIALISAFAFMSKKVAGIVLDVLQVKNAIEDLRHKRISNAAIEKLMNEDLEGRKKALSNEIVAGLKERAGEGYKEEHDAHLSIAVKKYVEFSMKGGEVDYLSPPERDDNDDGSDADSSEYVAELRELISDIRSLKGETLLLEDQSVGEDD